jgi:biotin-dependent carboxylase-like uncharacterized protein
MITIIKAGPLTTVQDRGRAGLAHLGVPSSGYLDCAAASLANRLVGNPPDAAVIETTFGGLRLRIEPPARVAVTGPEVPLRLEGVVRAVNELLYASGDAELSIGTPEQGVRNYVAIAGGLTVPRVLGSRSTDLLSGLGPSPLRAGETLPLGPAPPFWPAILHAPVWPARDLPTLRVRLAPHAQLFTPVSLSTFLAGIHRIASDSNRIAARLHGPTLKRRGVTEIGSQGLVLGGIEVAHDGQGIVLLADHPTTGGYPVVAVVHPDDLDAVAQLRPGAPLRLRVAA